MNESLVEAVRRRQAILFAGSGISRNLGLPSWGQLIDEMANHAARIRRYMDWFSVAEVETFIDRVLSVENLIDIN